MAAFTVVVPSLSLKLGIGLVIAMGLPALSTWQSPANVYTNATSTLRTVPTGTLTLLVALDA